MAYDEMQDDINNAQRIAQNVRRVELDNYSRLMGSLDGVPDVVRTGPSTIQHIPPLGIGGVETFIVQTFRQKDIGDYIFISHNHAGGVTRMVLPAKVAEVLARQRDQLTTKVRRKTAKRIAEDRKAAGILPGFMKGKKR